MPVMSKLQETLTVLAILTIIVYIFVIKPHYDLIDAKAEIQAKNASITKIKHESRGKVFESKYKATKNTLKEKANHEKVDINFTRGKHIIFLP